MAKARRTLTEVLYTYVEKDNMAFLKKRMKTNKVKGGRSGYINHLLTTARKNSERRKSV